MVSIQVDEIDTDERWQEDDTSFGVDPNKRWVVYTDISVRKKNASLFERLSGKHKVGEQIILMVCSPSYKRLPREKEDEEQLSKALIRNKFDQEFLTNYVSQKIVKIEGPTWHNILNELSKSFSIIP